MHPDTLGWAAAALMVATFSCREARHLRPLAVATNLAFAGYGAAAGLMPVLALHLLLLPINLWRWAQAVAISRRHVRQAAEQFGRLLCVVALSAVPLVAGCGGGGGDEGSGATSAPLSPAGNTPPTPPAATIGATGGTVSTGDGAQVAVPAGALNADVPIAVHATPAGAPALPPGLLALGKTYAFTPHGTTFAVPAKVTVPFDPAQVPAGAVPVLYKAEASGAAAGQWVPVAGATVQGAAMQAEVSSFSYFAVAPPLTFELVYRQWRIFKTGLHWPRPLETRQAPPDTGELRDQLTFGPVHLRTVADEARGYLYSNTTGATYWLGANTPAQTQFVDPTGGSVEYTQWQYFRKRDPAATLSLTISRVWVRGLDFDPRPAVPGRFGRLSAFINFEVTGTDRATDRQLVHRNGTFVLFGNHGSWFWTTYSSSAERLWSDLEFPNTLGANPASVMIELARPIKVRVPLDDVAVGSSIRLTSTVRIVVQDWRQRESSVEAFLQDPQSTQGGGTLLEVSGLDRDAGPAEPPAPAVVAAAPACPGADPAAGTLQFERAQFTVDEGEVTGALVVVTRTGGARGLVSARVATGVGTAVPGLHYAPVNEHVAFGDGDDGQRVVFVPIGFDQAAEPDRTVPLSLSEVRGCAAPGALTSATLTILDDDAPPPAPAPTFGVGGTVTGLAGTGLVLEDRAQLADLPVATSGSFTFAARYANGAAYDVRVKTPPTNPAQQCTVLRGSGVVGGTDVTDIEVSCITPPPPTGLDPGFGTFGKVASDLMGSVRAIARQSSGHLVATSGTRMVRFTPDGRHDAAFGGGKGFVDNLLPAAGGEAFDIAVGPDDRIVVAGRQLQPSRSSPFFQMAAARFLPDGTPDVGFGSGGVATFRLGGLSENARRVLVQPDGRVVLVGQAAFQRVTQVTVTNNDIAIVRLKTDGTLDDSFGPSGAVTADALLLDTALAALLQPDGRIFVAGSTVDSSADPTDSLFARFGADGTYELGFGRNPAYSALSDEIVDAALQPDGKIVLLIAARGLNTEVALARINADGSLDTGFGTNGLVRGDFGPHDDAPRAVALQADGKIVVGAQLSDTVGSPDFAVLRYLPDGALDASFGSGGVMRIDFFGGLGSANDLLVQPDGRIVAAGTARSGLSALATLVRLLP